MRAVSISGCPHICRVSGVPKLFTRRSASFLAITITGAFSEVLFCATAAWMRWPALYISWPEAKSLNFFSGCTPPNQVFRYPSGS